jgi:oligopeptide transport system substrate-binding protein
MKELWRYTLSFFLVFVVACASSLACQPQPASSGRDILRLWDTGPITLDPAISTDISSHTYIMQIFSGLVRLDEELKVVPDIAASWEKNSDGTSIPFISAKE